MGDLSPFFDSLFSPYLFLALLISLAVIPLYRRLAIKYDLVDHPGGRKQHAMPVPLVGGLAIITASLASIYLWGFSKGHEGLVFSCGGLFLIGFIDDKYDISAALRLIAQTTLVAVALYLDDVWLTQIALTKDIVLDLGVFAYPLTVVAVLALINAVNMLDGLDGLSSGIVLITLGFIISVASAASLTNVSFFATVFFGGVLGFWAYNYRFSWRERASVFMGDSGTIVLGFVLPYLAIKLAIEAPAYAPSSILLWLFAIPIWDICAVIIKRMRDGRSPLSAGRDHIHHVLMQAGLTVRHTLHLIYLLTITTVSFGFAAQYFGFSQIESFAAFFIFMTFYLGRVGSLSRKPVAEVYDFKTHGDRRKTLTDIDAEVVELNSRSKTLS
ncbi:undecaprenyl/decaprenyl-phosphate alpha-N-acetylglucosaminyl 1-phosphate transferase [Aliikangiella marina]|uniref:Undecaprenyl/decaprenyl-phosphate alpha-N-acetylglucosaminyl 1-phosphate transferase n=1 Tax=Aliikangiella marina TaxID=1712262 RepID=A0A545TIN4_9GAMM|nr:MraY family glycosyltransferase [Aliikangiella marina]TQV77041.1 undecaprenyl/decaprenyl-phosphate alpha-N-acetylglucosaminyl 1-phosphate transferase [Aliikangiella marina]